MEPEGSLQSSQNPSTDPIPRHMNPVSLSILCFFDIRFNTVLPATPEWLQRNTLNNINLIQGVPHLIIWRLVPGSVTGQSIGIFGAFFFPSQYIDFPRAHHSTEIQHHL
jgi:hypothetical protein